MKKIFALATLAFTTFGYSQEKEIPSFKKNELTINAPFLVAGAFDITYERILNEESGLGISVMIAFDDDIYTKYAITPFYRYYFGKKPASGFFVEGFGMLNQYDDTGDSYYYEYSDGYGNYYTESYEGQKTTDFALGFGLGSKWVTNKGFIFEINGGIGRNLFNENSEYNDNQIVGRGGILLGYRF
jgi:hypothetical protein